MHLPNKGEKFERQLWERGVLTWQDFIDDEKYSSLFYKKEDSILSKSLVEFEKGNFDYFAERLPNREQYRIALTEPNKVMFLDIETTGLSHYYDYITMVGWSIGGNYNFFINGISKEDEFRNAIAAANVIVTFNGSIFDLPFIQKRFLGIRIPKSHIDLRYLTKSFDLSGGQKKIEDEIGFKRPKSLQETDGFAATLLWDEYKWGKKSSLEKLIAYNHSDIEGMKFILDYCVKNIYKRNGLKKIFNPPFKFTTLKAKLDKKGIKEIVKSNEIPFDQKSLLKYEQLSNLIDKNTKIIGIDLTGSESKASGVALLNNNIVETLLIESDDELVEKIVKFGPNLVSIDSPLSLPKGRTTPYDDDSMREKYGIMRICERELKKRGVNVYPALIPSMQKLTNRGMELAKRLRKLGVPVIESYPGVVQDIIGLPRKQASVALLKKGLGHFGLEGRFLREKVSHDELDAITSAIVGLFFLSNQYEAIGDTSENLMIIPDLNKKKEKRLIIGVSGKIASGKTTVSRYLEGKGFRYIRYSEVIAKLLKEEKQDANRENLQKKGEILNQNQYQLCLQVFEAIKDSNKIVVDGLRHLEDFTFWFEMYASDFKLMYVDTPLQVREKRFSDKYQRNDFDEVDNQKIESSISLLKKQADHVLNNVGSSQMVFDELDGILKEYGA